MQEELLQGASIGAMAQLATVSRAGGTALATAARTSDGLIDNSYAIYA